MQVQTSLSLFHFGCEYVTIQPLNVISLMIDLRFIFHLSHWGHWCVKAFQMQFDNGSTVTGK